MAKGKFGEHDEARKKELKPGFISIIVEDIEAKRYAQRLLSDQTVLIVSLYTDDPLVSAEHPSYHIVNPILCLLLHLPKPK